MKKLTSLIDVRAATATDMPALVRLLAELTNEAPTQELIAAERLAQLETWPGSAVWVALNGGAIAATCTLIVAPNLTRGGAPWGMIENVVTSAAYRGKGFGRSVIAAAVGAAWEHGCYKVMLLSGAADPGVHMFYGACGFSQDKTGYQLRRVPARSTP